MGNSSAGLRASVWTALTLTALFFLSTGCTHGDSAKRFVGWENSYVGGDYPRAVEKWTREDRLYRGLELELLTHATFKSNDFRKAYIKEFARVYRLGQEQVRALEQEEAEAGQKTFEFMIAAYVPDSQGDDFARENSSWRMYFIQENSPPVPPEAVRKTKADPTIRHFFPYVSPWKSLYVVRFPKAPSAKEVGPIRLIITGVRGNIEMEWSIDSSVKGNG